MGVGSKLSPFACEALLVKDTSACCNLLHGGSLCHQNALRQGGPTGITKAGMTTTLLQHNQHAVFRKKPHRFFFGRQKSKRYRLKRHK